MAENGTVNGADAVVRKWGVYASLLVALLTFGKVVFFSGKDISIQEERNRVLEERVNRDELELARKDVLEPRLSNIEKTQLQEEVLIREQTQAINALQAELLAAANRGKH